MSDWTPCTTIPASMSPWWIRTADGGNSPCILGSPLYQSGCTLANCVGWAWGRFNQGRGSVDSRLPHGNAGSWFAQAQAAGMATGSEPRLGAVLCLSGGHVAIVEEIAADGTFINCSESDYGGAAFSYRTRYRSQNWELAVHGFQGFIYQDDSYTPAPGPVPVPQPDPPGPETGGRFKWYYFYRLFMGRSRL